VSDQRHRRRLCRAQPGRRHQWRSDLPEPSNLHQFDVLFSHSIGQDATDLTAYKLITASAARAGKVSEVSAVVDQAISTAV
jgi:hypothetical protein